MIREFEISVSKTINLGQYNSIRVEASLTVCVPEGDDFAELKRLAQEDLALLLAETYKAQRKGNE